MCTPNVPITIAANTAHRFPTFMPPTGAKASRWWLPLAVVLFGPLQNLFAIDPIGFERWTPNFNNDSGAFVDKTFSHVYTHWAAQLVGPGLMADPQKEKRLIDIEVRFDEKTQKPLVSGVWIENAGGFRKNSWLVSGVVASEMDPLIEYLKKARLIIRDLERYQRKANEVTVFAMIIEENPFDLDWDVFTGLQNSFLVDHANEQVPANSRMLDFDYLQFVDAPSQSGPLQQAGTYQYDLVTIENPPNTLHHVEWEFRHVDPNELAQLEGSVFNTLVDVEGMNQYGLYAIVVSGEILTAEKLGYNLDAVSVADSEVVWGPARDIEGSAEHEFGVYGVFFIQN